MNTAMWTQDIPDSMTYLHPKHYSQKEELPQEDRPREEDYKGLGNQFGVIYEGNLRVPATQSMLQRDHSLCIGTSPSIHGILITQG